MKKIIILALTLLALNSFSALELGIYEGADGDDKCLLSINNVSYLNNVKHPLNERVEVLVSFSESNFIVTHFPIINTEEVNVAAETELLKGAQASAELVEAIVMKMIHSTDYHGPDSFTYIYHDLTSGEKTKKVCNNLRKN